MKHRRKILFGLLILAIGALVIEFSKFRHTLFGIYDFPAEYAYKVNAEADLVIIGLTRFECGSCATFYPILNQAIQRDGNITYVPRLVTGQDKWEQTLARAVYAAAEQNKMIELISAIYANWPINSEQVLFDYAEAQGIDIQQLSRDMQQTKITDYITENNHYYRQWGFQSFPVLLVGKHEVFNYFGEMTTADELLVKFKLARKGSLF